MGSLYTCAACSKALSRTYSRLPLHFERTAQPAFRIAQRKFSTATPFLYHASKRNSADAKSEPIQKPHSSIKPSVAGIARKLREHAPLMTETYVAYGATRDLVKACIKPGEYKIPQALEKGGEIPTDENGLHIGVGEGWWYETLGLKPTFSNWTQITFIHMYLLQVRFRMFPKTHAPVWIQHLTNHIFYAAEDRLVVWHKVNSNSLRQRYLKDMFSQWRAVLLAYDEGLIKGDAMFAAAVWRNLLSAKEDVDFEHLAQVVAYIRKELQRLDAASDEDVANGQWTFDHNPGEELQLVKRRSSMMAEDTRKVETEKATSSP